MTNALVDSYGRRIDYVRLSVIEQCNFSCFYCMPNGSGDYLKRSEILTLEEIAKISLAFSELGVTRFRLTGGEPLMRKDIVSIAHAISATPGIEDISLSTNGYLLRDHIDALAEAGVSRINVSLDSINPETFKQITQGSEIAPVLEGLNKAKRAGIKPIKLNMVVMRGINDHDIIPMIEFAAAQGFNLRFIETMPIGAVGQDAMRLHISAQEILARIRAHYREELIPEFSCRGAGPASYYRIGQGSISIGVISAVSRHFCAGCNRVRVSAQGNLHLCLGDDHTVPLRAQLSHSSIVCLKETIREAIYHKPYRHNFGKLDGLHQAVDMSRIGG